MQRLRQAASVSLAHHLEPTRSTLRTEYRYYQDDFEIRAHTLEFRIYQYLSSNLLVGPSYRFYRQTGADFFATAFNADIASSASRTSDSDLAPFTAHRYGLKLLWLVGKSSSLDASFFYYTRSNDLTARIASFGYVGSF
jgi:hypothetical protein